MIGRNSYYRCSKISEDKFRQVVRLFSMDLTVTDTAKLTALSVRSTNTTYQRIRAHKAEGFAAQSSFECELESDES